MRAGHNSTCAQCPEGTFSLIMGMAVCAACPNVTVHVDLDAPLAAGAAVAEMSDPLLDEPVEVLAACGMLADSAAARRGGGRGRDLPGAAAAAALAVLAVCTLLQGSSR